MTEYNLKLEIQPEVYDYEDEEIVYRIWIVDDKYIGVKEGNIFKYCQLISERSFPKLKDNQILIDSFSIDIDNLFIAVLLENTKNKKVYIRGADINGIKMSFKQKSEYNDKNNTIFIFEYKKYFSQ